MSLSRRTGKFKLIENGIKYVEKESEEIIEWMKSVSNKVRKKYINFCVFHSYT